MRVLSAMEENTKQQEALNEKQPTKNSSSIASKAKKIRLDEEIVDLEKDEHELRGAPLKLTHIDRYFYAPKLTSTETTSKQAKLLNNSYQNPLELCQHSLNEIRAWNMNLDKVIMCNFFSYIYIT
jgi:hypothetical protein